MDKGTDYVLQSVHNPGRPEIHAETHRYPLAGCMYDVTSVFGPKVSLRNVRPKYILTAVDHMMSPLLCIPRTL